MQYSEGFMLDGRYSLLQYIGSGSFGEVWLARDCGTGVDVAVKIYVAMDNKGLEDFRREFRLSFDLNHTNLLHPSYLGVDFNDSRPYLVMPFCPDGSATRYAGKLDEKTLWKFVRDVASGLAYLHSQSPEILHQDIKPDNILIMKNGDFVISDFGISKQLKQTMRRSSMMVDTSGSMSYMGPERYGSNPIAVKASDIWALGISIFELATGELPFCGQGGIMLKNGAEMPELPHHFSDHLNYVVTSCLSKETWDRPTAAQLAKYAESILNGENPIPFSEQDEKNITHTGSSKTLSPNTGEKGMTGISRNSVVSSKSKMIKLLIIAVLAVIAVIIVMVIVNNISKERKHLDSVKQYNSELCGRIQGCLDQAARSKFNAENVIEDNYLYYMEAYRHILAADSLAAEINREVEQEIPDYVSLKTELRDSLSASYANLKSKAGFFMENKDTLIANTYSAQAQEISQLLSK